MNCKTMVSSMSSAVYVESIPPLGAAKCITLPSSLNMLTSSIAWMGWTFSFLSDVCSFLSSVPEDLCTFFVFRRGVPLPLGMRQYLSVEAREKPRV